MAYTYGLTGTTSVGLDTAISGLTNSAKGRIATRVFDVMLPVTTYASAYARLFSGASSAGVPCFISVGTNNVNFNSNAGIRFPDGLFVALSAGASCTVNYILENY